MKLRAVQRVLAVAEHETLEVIRDPFPYLVLVGMPLVVMAFVSPSYRILLQSQGFPSANGAEQAVPGMAVMFVFFLLGNIGFSFFQERDWSTWGRLMTTNATRLEVIAGKVLPYFVVVVIQQVGLLLAGRVLFSLDLGVSLLSLFAVAVSLAACLAACGVAVVAWTSTPQQVSAVQTLGTMVLAGLGGVLVTVDAMPGWAQPIAPSTPTYWAMRGYRVALLEQGGPAEIVPSCLAMLGFALVFGAIAWAGFVRPNALR